VKNLLFDSPKNSAAKPTFASPCLALAAMKTALQKVTILLKKEF
jgi:hypothetical protein